MAEKASLKQFKCWIDWNYQKILSKKQNTSSIFIQVFTNTNLDIVEHVDFKNISEHRKFRISNSFIFHLRTWIRDSALRNLFEITELVG